MRFNFFRRRPRVMLCPKELADVYALRTLYNYLKPQELDFKLMLIRKLEGTREKEILGDVPVGNVDGGLTKLIVGCFSDIGDTYFGGDKKVLDIDISILKNCVQPLSGEEKNRLKKKYDVVSDSQPVIVIGYAEPSTEVKALVGELWNDSVIYLVGKRCFEDFGFPEEFSNKVNVVYSRGVLKDYYAIADVAINADNLYPSNSFLHNFIEATEGGPLFMIPPLRSRQYGYRQLVETEVIREVGSLEDLISGVKSYISDSGYPNKKNNYLARRNAHIRISREKYLPAIFSHIRYMLGEIGSPMIYDLLVSEDYSIKLMHPDTKDWGCRKEPAREDIRDLIIKEAIRERSSAR